MASNSTVRTVLVAADREPLTVVFEMLGPVIEIPAFGRLRLVVSGPASAELTVGYGQNGVSIFRDPELLVRAFDGESEVDLSPFSDQAT